MAHSAKRTIDHEEIRRWVEERGGKPAHVKQAAGGDDPGILRIDYPGFSGEDTLEPIAWEQWFDWFEKNELAFLYQDERSSRFSKLVRRRGDEEEPAHSGRTAGAHSGGEPAHVGAVRTSQERDSRSSAGEGSGRRWSSRTERVTINDATAEELDALWGVGPANARRILAFRKAHGRIKGPDDLVAIEGIDGALAQTIAKQVDFG